MSSYNNVVKYVWRLERSGKLASASSRLKRLLFDIEVRWSRAEGIVEGVFTYQNDGADAVLRECQCCRQADGARANDRNRMYWTLAVDFRNRRRCEFRVPKI